MYENMSKNLTSIINWTDLERKSNYKIKIAGFKNTMTTFMNEWETTGITFTIYVIY